VNRGIATPAQMRGICAWTTRGASRWLASRLS